MPPQQAWTVQQHETNSMDAPTVVSLCSSQRNIATSDPPPSSTSVLSKLLCPFKAVVGFFFFNSFVPTDTFIIKVRKVVVGCLLISVIAYFVNMSFLFDAAGNPRASDHIYAIAGLIVDMIPFISIVVSFIYCRATMTAPDFVVGLPCASILVSFLFFAFSSATYDITSEVSAVIAVISMTAVGRLWYVVCLVLAIAIISVNCLIMSRTTDWMFPGVIGMFTPTALLTYATNQLLVFLIITYFLYAVVSEFDRMIHRAQGAASLSQELAMKLMRYDTDGAKELLQRCLSSDDGSAEDVPDALVVDGALLEAFSGIIHNLEQYRPHLPNYLLASGDTSSSDDAVSGRKVDDQITERVEMPRLPRSDSSSLDPATVKEPPGKEQRSDVLHMVDLLLPQHDTHLMTNSKVTVTLVDVLTTTSTADCTTLGLPK